MNIPRELVYEDKLSLSDFEINDNGSIDKAFYEILLDCYELEYYSQKQKEEIYLALFNDAYYIATRIFFDTTPELKFDNYCKIADGSERYDKQLQLPRRDLVLSMVYRLLDTIGSRPISVDRYFDMLHQWINTKCDNRWLIEKFPDRRFMKKPNLTPRPITPELMSNTSKRNIVTFFDEQRRLQPKEIERLVMKLGKNADEKLCIIDALMMYANKLSITSFFNYFNYSPVNEYLKSLKVKVAREKTSLSDESLPDPVNKTSSPINVFLSDETSEETDKSKDIPVDKIRLELFIKLLEKAGADLSLHGNKTLAADIMHKVTGLSSNTCKNYCTNRDLNLDFHRDEVTEINSLLMKLKLEIRLEP